MPTKKSAKRVQAKKPITRSSKQVRGVASVQKGRRFEDDVANLYKLQGAEVIRGIEINQKKVDLLVTFSYPVKHRVIVECKDEIKVINANQRVMQFQGLLTVARATGVADSAEIITRVPWGEAAKGFAHTAGISLLTYTEKLGKLIDFTPYLKDSISRFQNGHPETPNEPSLGSYYVDLSAELQEGRLTKKLGVINSYILDWLKSESADHHLAIFGEYGSGKSSLCYKLVSDLATSYLNNPSSHRVPLLLNLRDFIGKLDIEAYITSFLDRQCKAANPKIELFKAMNEAGTLLLIFDGFDEMAIKVDSDTLETNLMEIEKLASSRRSKILLTSRPEYFVSSKEESEALLPGVNPFANRATKYQPLKISPWTEKQVAEFLKKRVPLIKEATQSWTFYRTKINQIGSLADLSHRPVLLDMIVKTLPRLIASNAVINLPNLYETYLTGEIKRQRVLKKRAFLLDENTRLRLLQNLATELYVGSINEITFSDALSAIEQGVAPPKHEAEAYTRDFLTNSFLVRRGDVYHFSHKSISEYLVATRLYQEIQSKKPDAFGRVRLQSVIVSFLKELEPNPRVLWDWLRASRKKLQPSETYLGGNAATLLVGLSNTSLAGKDLVGTNLTGASLWSSDLRGTVFKNALMKNVRMEGAKLFRRDLEKCKLSNASVIFFFKVEGINDEDSWRAIWKMLEEKVPNVLGGNEYGELIGIGEDVINSSLTLVRAHVTVKHLQGLHAIQELLQSGLSTNVAFYADEVEALMKDEGSAVKINEFKSK